MIRACAGIITYNPDISRLIENVDSIHQDGIEMILIVDNGSSNIDDIKSVVEERQIRIVENRKNVGVAKALNQVFSFAEKNNLQWVLTLDQDSVCPANMMSEYSRYISNIEDPENNVLCPLIYDRNSSLNTLGKGRDVIEVKRCITSGCFTSVQCWKVLNGFDEYLFIDSVDWDFCDRAVEQGFRIHQFTHVRLLHEIGKTEDRKLIFWSIPVFNHNSMRKYYRTRNLIYLAKKNGSLRMTIKNNLSVMKIVFIILLYEKDKKEKMISVFKGYMDAIRYTKKRA